MGGKDSGASRRYAKALFNLSLERNELDGVSAALRSVTESWEQSPQLKTVLEHPKIPRERKKQILADVFQGSVGDEMVHFLMLLVEKDRAEIIPHVGRDFATLLDEHRREADAEAVTAIPMTPEQVATLKARLEAQSGLKLRLTTRVDESILGGLIVRVGDRMLDNSAATQLDALRARLKSVKVA